MVKGLNFLLHSFRRNPLKHSIFRYFCESNMKHSGAIKMENEPDLQKAKSEEYGLFVTFITIGVFAAMIAAFIWLYWSSV